MSLKDKPVTPQLGPSGQKPTYQRLDSLEQLPSKGGSSTPGTSNR